jgi:osmotically-inducible protein OsmY
MFWMQAQMPVPPIHIIVDSGKIILTGMAENEGQKTTALMLAQRVPGNFGVTNLIKVPPRGR